MKPIISFGVLTHKTADIWRKVPDSFAIHENGRWGSHWVQRLVFKAASNLGMVANAKIKSVQDLGVTRVTVDANNPIFSQMIEAVMLFRNHYGNDELEIVCDPSIFMDLKTSSYLARTMAFDVPYNYGTNICGARVRVVPGLVGWAVLPIEVLSKAERRW